MSQTPLAFMSYVNLNDQHDYGDLTQFRERLSGEMRLLTGEAFDIFQDRKDIVLGQPWQERINESLDAVTFLIPIITPSFFKSDACCAELKYFLKREEELGRGDLILPVYYATCPVLKDKEKLKHDPLAQIIAARQYADWRELRHEPFTSLQLRKAITKIAEQIVAALERSHLESSRAAAARQADTAKETLPSEPSKKDGKEAASSSNTFQSGGGPQSAALGNNPIGTQNNYYGPQMPIEAVWQLLEKNKPQPAPAAKTEPPTVVVDAFHRGDYATITEAIKAAKPGTRILVRPGFYSEGIVIDKLVEIIGDGNREEIVIESSGKSTIIFQANNGRIANLTLRQVSNNILYCVNIVQGRLELVACDILSQGLACVAILSGADSCLRGNRIHDAMGAGVVVNLAGRVILEDNEIFTNMLTGVQIIEGSNTTLRRNRIFQNSGTGILVQSGGGGIFEDNDLRGNDKGAWEIAPDCEARVQRSGNIE